VYNFLPRIPYKVAFRGGGQVGRNMMQNTKSPEKNENFCYDSRLI